MPQTGAYGAVQQNWRATSRQPIEVIVELTVNNLVLFIKKLECRSQLGRVSAKSEPYCPTPSSLFSRSNAIHSYSFDPLPRVKRTQCVQEDEERKGNGQTANVAANKVRGFSSCEKNCWKFSCGTK